MDGYSEWRPRMRVECVDEKYGDCCDRPDLTAALEDGANEPTGAVQTEARHKPQQQQQYCSAAA